MASVHRIDGQPLTEQEIASMAVDRILEIAQPEAEPKPWECSCGERFMFLTSLRFHEIASGHEAAS